MSTNTNAKSDENIGQWNVKRMIFHRKVTIFQNFRKKLKLKHKILQLSNKILLKNIPMLTENHENEQK